MRSSTARTMSCCILGLLFLSSASASTGASVSAGPARRRAMTGRRAQEDDTDADAPPSPPPLDTQVAPAAAAASGGTSIGAVRQPEGADEQEEEEEEEEDPAETAVIENPENVIDDAPEAPKLVDCMEWIPTNPTAPPASYAHCYDNTYEYALSAVSRPLRCDPAYFNLGEYTYQQIVSSTSTGKNKQPWWNVCVKWFNVHAHLPTAYVDLSRQTYPLNRIGNNADYELPACTGDCDSDSDCQPGLYCLQRNLNSDASVAFCEGVAEPRVDYCIPERYDDEDWFLKDYMEDLEVAMGAGEEDEEEDGPAEVEVEPVQDGATDSAEDAAEPNAEGTVQDIEDGDEVAAAPEQEQQENPAPDEVEDTESDPVDETNAELIPQEEDQDEDDESNKDKNKNKDNEDDEQEQTSSEDQTIADPQDRPRNIPVQVSLPSFFMALDVATGAATANRATRRRYLKQGPKNDADADEGAWPPPAVSVIDEDSLRIAVQNVLYDSIESIDERLWGVTLQVTNVDTIPVNEELTRQFFACDGEAIFLVEETRESSSSSSNAADGSIALDSKSMPRPLPEDQKLREAVAYALQKEALLGVFEYDEEESALPLVTDVGASFMDGTPITGSTTFIDGENTTFSSDEEGSFFTTLIIIVIAGAGGAVIFLIVGILGGSAIFSRRRARSDKGDLSPGSRSFSKQQNNSKFSFDKDPGPMTKTFSEDTQPISPTASDKQEKKKKQMDRYFEKLEEVESQGPSVDESYNYDVSGYDESVCGMSMSEWSVNDIGKDHVQLTDKSTLKPDKSIASMGKRMRQALGQTNQSVSQYAESEADISYAETDNMSALGDFRLGSVLGVDDANMSEYGAGELGGITEENSQDFTPQKNNKTSDFSAIWKTRIEGEDAEPVEKEVSPAKSIEDEVLGVSLSETNAAIKQLKKENNFLDVSHHAPRFAVGADGSDSEAEDEAMLFHNRAPTTINEKDELNLSSSSRGAASSAAPSPSSKASGPGSIIGSILGEDDDDQDDTVGYLDNSMVNDKVTNDTKGSGDKVIDDDVSDAESSVDMLESAADDVLMTKDANLLSEVASSNGTEEEPKFFQLELPAAYRQKAKKDDEDESVNESDYDHSLYEM